MVLGPVVGGLWGNWAGVVVSVRKGSADIHEASNAICDSSVAWARIVSCSQREGKSKLETFAS